MWELLSMAITFELEHNIGLACLADSLKVMQACLEPRDPSFSLGTILHTAHAPMCVPGLRTLDTAACASSDSESAICLLIVVPSSYIKVLS